MLVDDEQAREKIARICDEKARQSFQSGIDNADGSGLEGQASCLECAAAIRQTDLSDCKVEVVYDDARETRTETVLRVGSDEDAGKGLDDLGHYMASAGRLAHLARQLEGEVESLSAQVAELQKEIDGWKRYKQNVDEALNTGDGSYRP